ncbi:hypothetical protein C8J36_11147 [Rhizobium sp. PP-F2F-G48]|uniref:hypothetical protein n=1 Tax=Rhizobium sp. PP-F2F-G48 TaxID=2135651 RepID=UPI001048B484|nr:hypothetical protein [Rhizobium sp. PP-F2F-G48]TCM50715.1 hypothetical protein C8J36_11147 [Rhizobium sp. PP-F2F-G48]
MTIAKPIRACLNGFALLAAAAIITVAFVPEGNLHCDEPYLVEKSPDGHWTLTVCGRPMFFAMPGSGSDAPGWIVLRDENGAIRGVSDLGMLQLYGGAVSGSKLEWSNDRVTRRMVLDLPLDRATNLLERWWTDRIWRLRALAGLTPDDDALR